MSIDTIYKTRLTEVLANVGHNGCFTSTFLDNYCLIFVFKHSINYEINKIKKRKNTVCLRVLLKRKTNLDTNILFYGETCFIYSKQTHSESNKYLSSINKMPMILINNICVMIGARVC